MSAGLVGDESSLGGCLAGEVFAGLRFRKVRSLLPERRNSEGRGLRVGVRPSSCHHGAPATADAALLMSLASTPRRLGISNEEISPELNVATMRNNVALSRVTGIF